MDFMETTLSFALGGLIVSSFWAVWLYLMQKKKGETIFSVISASTLMDSIAQKTIRGSSVERVLVLCTTNGGGKPKLSSDLYATAIVNQVDEKHETRRKDYNKLPIDMDYRQRLERAKSQGVQVMYVETMPPGLLRTLYEGEKVQYSEMYYLYETDEAFFYCSFANYSDDNLHDARADIALAVNEFKRVLKAVFSN